MSPINQCPSAMPDGWRINGAQKRLSEPRRHFMPGVVSRSDHCQSMCRLDFASHRWISLWYFQMFRQAFIVSHNRLRIPQAMGEPAFPVNANRRAFWPQRRYPPTRSPAPSEFKDRIWHRRGIPKISRFLYQLQSLSVLLPSSSYGPFPDVCFHLSVEINP